jgi:hypothetical protein
MRWLLSLCEFQHWLKLAKIDKSLSIFIEHRCVCVSAEVRDYGENWSIVWEYIFGRQKKYSLRTDTHIVSLFCLLAYLLRFLKNTT